MYEEIQILLREKRVLEHEIERLCAEVAEVKAERDRYLAVAGRLSGWLPMPDVAPYDKEP